MTTPSDHIDLRSDTVTKPSAAMRRAIADAEVGDDVLDGDPTVRRLEARVSELLGTERALFFPTGTMANQTAIWLLAKRGTQMLVDATSHIVEWEVAGSAALAGVQARAVHPSVGHRVMDAQALRSAALSCGSRASLVCLENTHNGAGGVVTAPGEFDALVEIAKACALPVHLDGARLWNAAAATGVTEARLAERCDAVMVSFAKGLGAPVGAALAGSADLLRDAWDVRKRFGGGMRQSGIIAAGALHGLNENRARLVDDHRRARSLGDALHGAGGASVVTPMSNIVMIDLPDATADVVAARAAESGVRITAWTATRLRAVTHLDIDDAMIRRAGDVLARTLEQSARSTGSESGAAPFVASRR